MSDGKSMFFRKVGGRHQLVLDSPAALFQLLELDDAHWMATSAPVETFNCDLAFTKFLDSDGNGRIRSDELRAACEWILSALGDVSVLADSSDVLSLSAINSETEVGKALRASAELMLANLNAENTSEITLVQTRCRQDILSSGECNGDGVIPVSTLKDAELADFLSDVIAVSGGAPDAGGGEGVTSEIVDKFMSDLNSYLEWIDRGELRDEDERNDILTWGADTSVAYDVLAALEKKIDQYFAQCSLLALDGGFEKRFSAGESEVSELDVSDVAAVRARMEHASLTKPTSEERLTFDDRINPFYRTAAANFAERVLKRWKKGVRVKNALTSAEWNALKGEFAKFAEWRSAKPVGGVEKLPMEKLRAYSTAGYEKMLAPIFEKDKAVAKEIQRVEELERLILYKKHMMEFVNNFVSFSSLYDPSSLSMLQVGRLVMDARHFELNLNVSDIGKHKKTAADSNICVMYLKLTTKTVGAEKTMNVATGVTSGTVRNIRIGKRGVFMTPDGMEWDAEVVDFIQHPVSIIEALFSPFAKVAALVKKHTEKLKTSAYKKIEGGVDKGLTGAEKALASGASSSKLASSWTGPMLLLGGGIGVAGIGSAFASVMNALKGEGVLLKIALFALGVVLVVATPIVVAAVLKLRHRNIAMMLEACGWSINASMRMNRRLGLLFTRVPAYPRNSRRTLYDQTRYHLAQLDVERRSKGVVFLAALAVLVGAVALGTILRGCFGVDGEIESIVSGSPKVRPAAHSMKTPPPQP